MKHKYHNLSPDVLFSLKRCDRKEGLFVRLSVRYSVTTFLTVTTRVLESFLRFTIQFLLNNYETLLEIFDF